MVAMWLVVSQALLVGLALASPLEVGKNSHNDKHIVDVINDMKTTFTARHYPQFEGLTKEELGRIFGNPANGKQPRKMTPSNYHDVSTNGVEGFDSRDAWPQCKETINSIQIQGKCVASWAISVASSLSDRRCIEGISTVPLSAWDIVTCCDDCQLDPTNACNGGDFKSAFDHYIFNGIVTGGGYYSSVGCKPWPYAINQDIGSTRCAERCARGYPSNYTSDLVRGRKQSSFQNSNIRVMEEIQKNGPVVTRFDVYEDFVSYRDGVYRHKTGSYVGEGFAKIIGWGVDALDSYWLAVGSYGANWGNNGTFKIDRGTNECNFESIVLSADVHPPQ